PSGREDLQVVVDLVELHYDDEGSGEAATELYQVPVAFYAEQQERLGHALIGEWHDPDLGTGFAYDAVHDRESMALWLQAFAAVEPDSSGTPESDPDALLFHRLAGHELDLSTHSTLFSGEQSN